MARLWSDGFDLYASAASNGDMATRYDAMPAGNSSLVSSANTAFGVGQAYQMLQASTVTTKTFITATNETTIFFSIRLRLVTAVGTPAFGFQLLDGTNIQCTVCWNSDLSIAARSGNSTSTVIGSVASAFVANVWDSYQGKIVINNTTGSVEIRKNGSATPILSLTNVNTRAGSTNSYANRFQMLLGTSTTAIQIDDLFVWSDNGASPTTWSGDLRAVVQYPNGPGSVTQLTPSSNSWWTTPTTSASNTNQTRVANRIDFVPVTLLGQTGPLSMLGLYVSTAFTGHLKLALYSNSSGTPGSLLGASAEIVNPTTGLNTAVVTGGPILVPGTSYFLAIFGDTSFTSLGSASAQNLFTQTQSYASGFPTSPSSLASTPLALVNCLVYVTPTNASLAGDAQEDGDTSYVYSNTVGNEDLYTVASLPVYPLSIIGTNVIGCAAKTDSGTRTATLQISANGTETSAASSVNMSNSYTFTEGWMPLDPTGAAWTTPNLNSMQIGVKVTG